MDIGTLLTLLAAGGGGGDIPSQGRKRGISDVTDAPTFASNYKQLKKVADMMVKNAGQQLKKGDVVEFAGEELRHLRKGTHYVVVEVLSEPLIANSTKSGESTFHTKYDIKIALFEDDTADGDVVELYSEAKRFNVVDLTTLSGRARLNVERLQKRLKKLEEAETFAVGDVVTWKKGLRNKGVMTGPRDVGLVISLHPGLLDLENEVGTTYYRTPIDIRLLVTENGKAFEVHLDARRLRKVSPAELE